MINIEFSNYFLISCGISVFLALFYDISYNRPNYEIIVNKMRKNLKMLSIKNKNYYKLEPIYYINIFFYSMMVFFITVILFCYSYIISDFSVINISLNSNILEAFFYKISGFWGNKEGSMVLWSLVLFIYNLIIFSNLYFYKYINNFKLLNIQSYNLFIFIIFLIYFSNPFIKNNIFIFNGKELNPILQDPTLIIHPPFLYMGYLGFSLLFIIGILVLREKNISFDYLEYFKYINIITWLTLTFGIGLGSWWAYYELGWGGWWFWDPVENLSLIPWLFSLSLLHFFTLNEKKNLFFNWSLSLILLLYIIVISSSFLVRCGLLVSVHSFAQDLQGSILIFIYLLFIFIFIFIFYKLYYNKLLFFYVNIFSKENIMKFLNILIIILGFITLLSIIFPLIINFIYKEKINLVAHFYNQIFIPFILPFSIMMVYIPLISQINKLNLKIKNTEFILSFIILFYFLNYKYLFYIYNSILIIINILIFIYLLFIFIKYKFFKNMMMYAHISFILFILSITLHFNFQSIWMALISPGDQLHYYNYNLLFRNIHVFHMNDHIFYYFDLLLKYKQYILNVFFNEHIFFYFKEFLNIKSNINSTFFKDFYLILGNGVISSGWYMKLFINPFINILWLSIIILILTSMYSIKHIYFNKKIYFYLEYEVVYHKWQDKNYKIK